MARITCSWSEISVAEVDVTTIRTDAIRAARIVLGRLAVARLQAGSEPADVAVMRASHRAFWRFLRRA